MNRIGMMALVAAAGLFAPLAAHAQWPGTYGQGQRFSCESVDGRYRECRVDTRQGVQMVRQTSRTQCIEGHNWGIGRDVVWVDRGCRAEFVTGAGYGYGRAPDTRYGYGNGYDARGWNGYRGSVICESVRDRNNRCPIDTRYGVVLVRQLSSTRCREGHNWGVDPGAIWVDHGCRAEFAPRGTNAGYGNYGSYGGYGAPRGQGYGSSGYGYGQQRVSCASNDGRRNYCRAPVSRGAELVRQVSRSACIQGRNWGWDRGGVWVADGCRGEFRVW